MQQAEEEYVRDYGVYPINHVVVIRDDALRRLPKLPQALFEAYAEAKKRAYKRRLGTTLMPWGTRHWNKVFDQFGGNPLPYGLTDLNRSVVDRLKLRPSGGSIPTCFLTSAPRPAAASRAI